ncbi:MAG TPA: hypothetical protein VKS81_00615 [Bacteroidota bacterium]|nr:hypothetical protein [Bacteroidota bacterium]
MIVANRVELLLASTHFNGVHRSIVLQTVDYILSQDLFVLSLKNK